MTKISLRPYFEEKEISADAEIKLGAGILSIRYAFSGAQFILENNEKKIMQRQDYLYENTCFELFLKPKNAEHYYEYHFALTGALNAYSLTHYRSSLTKFNEDSFVGIKNELINEKSLIATVPLPGSKNAEDYEINITAVYKANGRTQYYALSHGSEKADFHDFKQFSELKELI